MSPGRRDERGRDRRVEEVGEARPRAEPGERLVRVAPPEPEVDERPEEEERGPEPDEPEVVDDAAAPRQRRARAARTRAPTARNGIAIAIGRPTSPTSAITAGLVRRQVAREHPDPDDHGAEAGTSRSEAGGQEARPLGRAWIRGQARPHGHAATVERRPDGIRPESPPCAERLAVLVLFLALAGTAQAARGSRSIVVPPDDPFPTRTARSACSSRARATRRAARPRSRRSCAGKVEAVGRSAASRPGKPLISLATRPGRGDDLRRAPPAREAREHAALPGRDRRRRLPRASSPRRSTRIRGLVSIADIAPTAVALERGKTPRDPLERRRRPRARRSRKLDRRLTLAHDVRLWATLILVFAVLGGALLAFAYRTEYLGRAGVAAAPAVLAVVARCISAIGVSRSSYVVWLLAAGTAAAALAVAVPRRLLPWALVALVLAYLVVLVGWTEVSSLRRDRRAPGRGRPLLRRAEPRSRRCC